MYKLGIDLGGTNIKLAILDEGMNVLCQKITLTPHEGGNSIEDTFIYAVHEMCAENNISLSEISKGGIAIPGVVTLPKGPVLLAPNVGWHGRDPASYLEERLGIEFFVGNDADCMALAENFLGAGRNFESFLMLSIGTGLGGAIVQNGKLFTGLGPYGGEFGHVPMVHGGPHCNCGQNGCLEQYTSVTALKRIAAEMSGHEYSPEDLIDDLYSGNELAEKIVDLYTTYLSEGITGYINVFRPHGIIIGGGIATSGPALFDRINAKIPAMAFCSDLIPVPPVVPAELGMYAGAMGAALL